jgi:4-alpha-glucanotransferase
MKKLKLVLGLHSSIALGTSKEQFEHAYNYSFKPFLTVLYKYPKIRAVLHLSGIIYELLEDAHPEYLMLINEMVKRRQLELIGGAYYSPVLPLIPAKDRVGQMELLTTYMRKKFGKRPRGCWISEGMWEQSITANIKSSGLEYIFIDDVYFEQAGITRDSIHNAYITDDQGKSLVVLPLDNEFIRNGFTETPESYINKMRKLKEAGQADLLSILWNGEYFYSHSQRHEEIFAENGRLETFFSLLSQNTHTIQTVLPVQELRSGGPYSRIYLPSALNIDEKRRKKTGGEQEGLTTAVARGELPGFFRKNLLRYPEASRLYSKMMYVHLIVGQVRRDRSRKNYAKEESWKGQGHIPFWHGCSGGIYINSFRKAAYTGLIEAEKSTREKGIFSTAINSLDFDMDGIDEYLYQGQFINVYVHKKGGSVFELDYVVTAWNYLDLMSRYREEYHDKEDLANGYDLGPLSSFVDSYLSSEYGYDDYFGENSEGRYSFGDVYYHVKRVDKEHKDLELEAHRRLDHDDKEKGEWLHMQKYYDFQKNSVNVGYRLQAEKGKKIKGDFATEISLSFPDAEKEKLIYSLIGKNGKVTEIFDGKIDLAQIKELAIYDKVNRTLITLTASEAARVWVHPVYTITECYGKKVRVYQGSTYVFLWECSISGESGAAQNSYERSISLRIEKR